MRLCQSHVRALWRSFAVNWLLSGVIASLALVAAIAGAWLGGAWLDHRTGVQPTPVLAVGTIAAASALLLSFARATLLNRRAAWLQHSLSEVVLAHELWRGSEATQRNRSLSAVSALSRFSNSQAARALSDVPWAIAALGGLWFIQPDLAALANAAAVLLLALALTSSRITTTATRFDTASAARRAGDEALGTGGRSSDLALDDARRSAARWELTQRALIAATYAGAQSASRRRLAAVLIQMLSACALGWVVMQTAAAGAASTGDMLTGCAIALAAQWALARWAIGASDVGAARAAARHLATLRVARNSQSSTRLHARTAPDLRAPVAAAWLTAAVALAGLAGAVNYWHLPVLEMTQSLFAAKHAKRQHAAQNVNTHPLPRTVAARTPTTASLGRKELS